MFVLSQYWMIDGRLEPVGNCIIQPAELEQRIGQGAVFCSVGSSGTRVTWHTQSRSMASLFAVVSWLFHKPGPFLLNFFASGWFEETFDDAADAARRIEALLARSDRHFPSKYFSQEVEPSPHATTPFLSMVLASREVADDACMVMRKSPEYSMFVPDWIGEKTCIGKLYGNSKTSFPFISREFSAKSNEAYNAVAASERPRLDHVLASFHLPNQQQRWVSYHSVVLPMASDQGCERVKVVTEFAPVRFRVV